MISSNDFYRLDPTAVPLEWHEAVAVAIEVGAQCINNGSLPPTVQEVGMTAIGNVVIPRAELASSDQAQLVAMRALLNELLAGRQAPNMLLNLASDTSANAPSSLSAFMEGLAFFARPGAQNVRSALAERLRAQAEVRRVNAELEGLTRKARAQDPNDTQQKPANEQHARQRPIPVARIAVAVMLFAGLGAAVAAAFAWTRGDSRSVMRIVQEVPKEIGRAVAGLQAPSSPAKIPEPVQKTTEAAASSTRGPRRRADAGTPDSRAGGTAANAGTRNIPLVALLGDSKPLPEGRVIAETVSNSWNDDAAYDASSPGVIPAELLKPQLIPEPVRGVARNQLGKLQIMVSPEGTVEQVRLISSHPDRNYYDVMMLAAAKAWRFAPAKIGGRPVRYLFEIAITH